MLCMNDAKCRMQGPNGMMNWTLNVTKKCLDEMQMVNAYAYLKS